MTHCDCIKFAISNCRHNVQMYYPSHVWVSLFLFVNEQSTEKYKTSKSFSVRLQHQHMICALAAAFEVFRVTFCMNRFPLRFLPVSFMLSEEAVQKVFYFSTVLFVCVFCFLAYLHYL